LSPFGWIIYHGAVVATAPGEKTPHRTPPCEELNPLYDIKLVFEQKITFVLRKIKQKLMPPARAALFDCNMHQTAPQTPSCIFGAYF